MTQPVYFISNNLLYQDLAKSLLVNHLSQISFCFSTSDIANVHQIKPDSLFIFGHEFVEDSVQDLLHFKQMYPEQAINPILLFDEFEADDTIVLKQDKTFKAFIKARPMGDEAKRALRSMVEEHIQKHGVNNKHYSLAQKQRLIIDDDGFIGQIFKESLDDIGLNSMLATNCLLASEALYQVQPALIFLDYNLPDFDGLEFLRTIKSDPKLKDIPVVVMTGDTAPNLDVLSKQNGAVQFLKKPVSAQRITHIAKTILMVPSC